MLTNPFEQFIIHNYHFAENSYTNFFLVNDMLILFIFSILNYLVLNFFLNFRKRKLNTNIFFNILKLIYQFIYSTVISYLGKNGNYYFSFFFYLFIFIAQQNLVGILPYSFTTTSHLSVTFGLAFMIWFGITITGFQENGLKYFDLIFPRNIPFLITPFLNGIELISYIFRPVSLALRLFANIVAGHILLDTIALFIHKMTHVSSITLSSLFISIIPFIICCVLIIFECIVAILQAYIFIVLSCIYLRDVYNLHH